MPLPDPSIFVLAPESNILPAPSALLEAFSFIGFFLHILSVNMVAGLTMVIFLRLLMDGRHNPSVGDDAFWLSKGLAFNVNLAIVPLLFMQAMLAPFIYSSAIIMGLWFLGIPFFVMLAYYGLYLFNQNAGAIQGRNTLIMGVVLVIFLAVAFLYTNLNTLMLTPLRWPLGQGNPDGLALNLGEPSLWPRYAHNVLGFMAFGGLTQALLAEFRIKRGNETQKNARSFGLTIFGHAMAANALIGVWYLFSIAPGVREDFLGGDQASLAALILSAIGSLTAIWAARSGRLKTAFALAVAVLAAMCFLRHMMRKFMLTPYLEEAAHKPFDVGPLVMFIFGVAATAVVLVAILRKAFNNDASPKGEQEAKS